MPLQLYNLDDRGFKDLVAEALSLLPLYAPDWTDHNPSDPGITLVELLAYLTETLIYRLNRITRENKIKFLQLLRGLSAEEAEALALEPVAEVDRALQRAVLELTVPQRAVTCEDYETLALSFTPRSAEVRVARALCVAGRDLRSPDQESGGGLPGHLSLVVVPDRELPPRELPKLVQELAAELDLKRLIATRLHVVGPRYLHVSLRAVVATLPDADAGRTHLAIAERVRKFFDPLPGGGPEGAGWPFGRALHLSELYEQCQKVEGVDYVRDIQVLNLTGNAAALARDETAVGIQIGLRSTVGVDTLLGCETGAGPHRLVLDGAGKLIGIKLRPYELVRIQLRVVSVGAAPE
jgi:hypothetical protein